jgi:hypothetical protein
MLVATRPRRRVEEGLGCGQVNQEERRGGLEEESHDVLHLLRLVLSGLGQP